MLGTSGDNLKMLPYFYIAPTSKSSFNALQSDPMPLQRKASDIMCKMMHYNVTPWNTLLLCVMPCSMLCNRLCMLRYQSYMLPYTEEMISL